MKDFMHIQKIQTTHSNLDNMLKELFDCLKKAFCESFCHSFLLVTFV